MAKQGGGSGSSGGGGAFRAILLLALLGLVGYNTYTIHTLQGEVAALRHGGGDDGKPSAEAAASAATEGSTATVRAEAGSPKELMAAARRHTQRAGELLRDGRYAEARREIEQASADASEAGGDARSEGANAVAGIRDTAHDLEVRAQRMLATNSTDAGKAGAGGGESGAASVGKGR